MAFFRPIRSLACGLGLLVATTATQARASEPDSKASSKASSKTSADSSKDAPKAGPEPAPTDTETTDAEVIPRFPKHGLTYSNLFGFRYNALGLFNIFSLGYRYQLFDRPGPLFEDSYIAIKALTFLAPPYARVGAGAEIQPIAALKLSASYEFEGVFGIINLMQSWDSAHADFSDTALREGGKQGRNYPTHGHIVKLGGLLQAKVWKIAVRNDFKAIYTNYRLENDDTVYYNQAFDVLAPNAGWIITNDADLLMLMDFGLKFGARYTMTHSFYEKEHFLPGEVQEVDATMHRVGPAVLYTFFNRPQARFNAPTVFLLAQWWAAHRWRTGQDVSQGLPYLLVGFVFNGQLAPNRK